MNLPKALRYMASVTLMVSDRRIVKEVAEGDDTSPHKGHRDPEGTGTTAA